MGPGSEAGATKFFPRAQNQFIERFQQIHPTGKSLLFIGIIVKSLAKKYFCFTETQISLYQPASRPVQRGVAQRTGAGRGCDGRGWLS